MSTLVIVTLTGPDAEEIADLIGVKLEDIRQSPEGWDFDWQTETLTITGKNRGAVVPRAGNERCPWTG